MNNQCEGCVYRKAVSPTNISSGTCCHYMYETYRRKEVDKDGKCLSKKVAKPQEQRAVWGWDG